MAAGNSGGLVIVQAERVAERNTLNPRQVDRVAVTAYAATIAAFLGGAHCGQALREGGHHFMPLIWGVIPPRVG